MLVKGTKQKGNLTHKPKNKLHCTYCNRSNHAVDQCFFLHDFPSKKKKEGKKKGEKIVTSDWPQANNIEAESSRLA